MTSNTGEKLNISKQIIMTGDNLLDAQPRVDNQVVNQLYLSL